jgi:hypothetical protein
MHCFWHSILYRNIPSSNCFQSTVEGVDWMGNKCWQQTFRHLASKMEENAKKIGVNKFTMFFTLISKSFLRLGHIRYQRIVLFTIRYRYLFYWPNTSKNPKNWNPKADNFFELTGHKWIFLKVRSNYSKFIEIYQNFSVNIIFYHIYLQMHGLYLVQFVHYLW